MAEIKVIAFDCDGVMFDTRNANEAYYNEVLWHFGKPALSEEQFAYIHMHTVDQSIAYLFGNEEDIAKAQAYRLTMPVRAFFKYMTIEPFLKPLLKKIRPDYKTAVATNRTNTIQPLLEAFDLLTAFDLVVGADDVPHPKPRPDLLWHVLEHFGCLAAEALYVGDSQLDEAAAAAAEMPLVAYRNPSLTAAHHVNSLKEIETLLGL
jgi:HAD superfamily hydrolase (TIGR01549 family)